jgi:hypothetical protein
MVMTPAGFAADIRKEAGLPNRGGKRSRGRPTARRPRR